jgi:hypothetical protein
VRKRASRPPRFVAIDNGAADDDQLHVLALGLLTLLLRARDGDDVTVEGISKRRKEGREALAGAMRNLVSRAYVVKFKVHGADGKWRTEFTADSIPFTREDIAEMLPEVSAGARTVKIEPEWIDPREDDADRPTGSRRSVVTSENKGSSQVGTTYGIPTVGRTTVGSSAAKKIKTGEEEDSLSGARDSRDDGGEREAAAPDGAVPEPRTEQPEPEVRPGVRIARRWAAERTARGLVTSDQRVAALAREAEHLLASGKVSVERLEHEVAVMAEHPTWFSLLRHMESVPLTPPAAGPSGDRPRSPGKGLSPAALAILARGSGL